MIVKPWKKMHLLYNEVTTGESLKGSSTKSSVIFNRASTPVVSFDIITKSPRMDSIDFTATFKLSKSLSFKTNRVFYILILHGCRKTRLMTR